MFREDDAALFTLFVVVFTLAEICISFYLVCGHWPYMPPKTLLSLSSEIPFWTSLRIGLSIRHIRVMA